MNIFPELLNIHATLIADFPKSGSASFQGMDSYVSDNNVVGQFYDAGGIEHGFLYNGSGYTTLDYPGSTDTEAFGISGNNVIGAYYSGGTSHGFLYNVPEPSTLALIGISAVGLLAYAWRLRCAPVVQSAA
jgi:hypothetical protein